MSTLQATTALDIVEAYMESVFRRGREPMEPVDFHPDWADQPSRHKIYPGAERIALPRTSPDGASTAAAALAAMRADGASSPGGSLTLTDLAWILRTAYAPLDRRLRITWNQDTRVRELYPEAIWGRGTASGGGMYPLEIYLAAAGDIGGMLPGLYHYATAHHALERLGTGDAAAQVGAAATTGAGSALVVTTRFWKNSFKYNSFAYHVVTQDLGALLWVTQLLARSTGCSLRPLLGFDDRRLNALLGEDDQDETALAVIPLDATRPAAEPGQIVAPVSTGAWERSRRVRYFEQVTEVHDAVLAADRPEPDRSGRRRPAPEPVSAVPSVAAAPRVVLPEPLDPAPELTTQSLLRARRSSFGAFSSRSPLDAGEVSTLLRQASRAPAALGTGAEEGVGLYLVVNRMTGVEPGGYRYDQRAGALDQIVAGGMADFLQRSYFLSNYNLREAAAVVAVAVPWPQVRARLGARGYRTANVMAAAAGQAVNVAATAVGVASGIVLGFDNIAFDELLGLTDERTFLFVILGRNASSGAEYRFELP